MLHINNSRWRGVPFILKCGKALNERKAEIRVQFAQPSFGLFASGHGPHERLGVGQEAAFAPGGNGSHAVHNNELVIRIQEEESIYLKMMCKMPVSDGLHESTPPAPIVPQAPADPPYALLPFLDPCLPTSPPHLPSLSPLQGLEFFPAETELNLSYKSRYPTRSPPEAYARLILDVLRGDQSQFVRADELAAAWAIFTPILHAIDAGGNPALKPVVYPYGSRGPM